MKESIRKIKIFLWRNKIILLIILVAVLIRVWNITQPLGNLYDINFQAYIAKNHYEHGLINNNFLNVIAYNENGNVYHLTHPPLLQIFIYFSFLIFGVTSWAARLVPVVFSIASLIFIYLLVLRVWSSKKLAYFSAAIFAIIPMSSFFGRVVNYEAMTLFFVILTLYCYLKLKDKNKWVLFFLILSVMGGVLSDWAYYFVLPGIFLHSMITKRNRKQVFLVCSLAVGFVLIYLSYVQYFVGEDIIKILTGRAAGRSVHSFLLDPNFYKRLLTRNYLYFTAVPLVLSLIYFLSFWRWKKYKSKVKWVIPLLFFQPFIYFILFPQAAYQHDWHSYYFVAGVSIVIALVFANLLAVKNRILYILVICLVSLFLFQSIKILYEKTQVHTSRGYEIAMFINEHTNKEDNVYLIQYLGSEFYLNSELRCNMLFGPNISCVEKYDPKFIVYSSRQSMDTDWARDEFTEKLINDYGYYKVLSGSGVRILSKENINSNSIVHNFEEVFFTQGGDTVVKAKIRFKPSFDRGSGYSSTIFQHALKEDRVYINYPVGLKNDSKLFFGISLEKSLCGSGKGDGVIFEILVQQGEVVSKVFSEYIDPKNNEEDCGWHSFEVDLSKYDNQNIILKFLTLPGPKNNNNSDWALWGNPVIETL